MEKSEIILDMACQIGSAMFYLEKNGFIHRDLVRPRKWIGREGHEREVEGGVQSLHLVLHP